MLRRLQLLLHDVSAGLRRHRHCVDRALVCHLPGGLGSPPLSATSPSELQKTGRDSLYWRKGGVFWPALVAQVIGMYAAISALSVTFHLPHWLNLVTLKRAIPDGYGADFSVFLGMGVAAVVYLILGDEQGYAKEADAGGPTYCQRRGLPASA